MVRRGCGRGLEHALKRGDVVTAALPGDYGKPRPAVVVQADRIAGLASVLLCPCTSEVDRGDGFRVAVTPTSMNGLRVPSQIMVEKVTAVARTRCGPIIGDIEPDVLDQVDASLAFVLGLAD